MNNIQNQKIAATSLIVFDGICNLCCWWVQFIIRHDKERKFKFATLQSDTGKQVTNSFLMNEKIIDSILYVKDEVYYIESQAFFEILKEMGNGWRLFLVFSILPRFVSDFIYRIVARNRFKIFGQRITCLLPTDDLKSRFLE